MSNTPRTDSMRGFHDLDTAVDAEFSEQLERELNAANAKIKRLEEAAEKMIEEPLRKHRRWILNEAKQEKP